MSQPLDELYFTWLYGQVASPRVKAADRSYWSLLRQLYTKEFVWLIPNDDNRVEDGRDLRDEFIQARRLIELDQDWFGLGCSTLEMIIGLSRRLSFEADGEPREWFWHLMENLDLVKYTDEVYDDKCEKRIDSVLDKLIFRNYKPDGRGGLFPLKYPERDQREVELWYQLSAYLLERI